MTAKQDFPYTQGKILIDVGSSTVKAYYTSDQDAQLALTRSIPFKKDFDPEAGISEANKKELYELIEAIKKENPNLPVKVFATSIFRKMALPTRTAFIDEFFERTHLFFNIIDQDLENFYLQMALVGKSNLNQPILLINIGGGSTELVVMYGLEAIEQQNLNLGVDTINQEFPSLNEPYSGVSLNKVKDFALTKLPPLKNKVKIAFYSGGELTYMQLTNYPLRKNTLFQDGNHPFVIFLKDFAQKNEKIYQKVKLQELENLMPENSTWMHGARGCSSIAQAICERYGVETVIPSDSNLIDGVVRQEFRHVTISGSFRKHLDYILRVRSKLVTRGVQVLSPRFVEPKNPDEEFVVFTGEEGFTPLELERHHLDSIGKSDALIVCDPQGYVGASALIEIGFANALGKRIVFVEKPEEFMLSTLPAEIGL